jgi:hypothetical protein
VPDGRPHAQELTGCPAERRVGRAAPRPGAEPGPVRQRHRNCIERWHGAFIFDGERYRVVAVSEADCQQKRRAKREELQDGIVSDADYTVARAVKDCWRTGLPSRSKNTVDNAKLALAGRTTTRWAGIRHSLPNTGAVCTAASGQ